MKLFNQIFPKREREERRFVITTPAPEMPDSTSYIVCRDGTLKPIDDPALVEHLDKSSRDG